jgi:hypothetical protein
MIRKHIVAVLGVLILAVAAAVGSPGPTNAEPPVGSMLVVPVCTPGSSGLTAVLRFYFEGTGPLTPLSDIPPYPDSLVNDPSYAAFSSQGELFVANRHGGAGGSIARFTFDAAGDPVANGSITGNSLDNVHGLAFSPAGELFAANWANGIVSRFLFDTAGNAIPNGTIVTGQYNQGLAFSANGELFAATDSGMVYRFVFDPVTQEAIPNGSLGGGSHGLTFNAQGELFVADPYSDLVFRFLFDGLGNAVENGTISVPGGPLGVAFSSAGELFVTGHVTGGISRFLFDVNGDAIPNGFTPTDYLGGPAILAGVTAPTPTPTPAPPVGGVAALPEAPRSSGLNYIALAALAAAAVALAAVTGGARYARRRWLG